MKILYFDCNMGAAGDMLTASLLDTFENKDKILSELNNIGIKGVRYEYNKDKKCGITGTHVSVKVNDIEESEETIHRRHDHVPERRKLKQRENEKKQAHLHEENHNHSHDHSHTSLADIKHIVNDHLKLPKKVKKDVIDIYTLLAKAEAQVHDSTINDIHFHEVGTKDAIADISAVCYLIDKIKPDEIYASSIHVGSGTVKCAHGILPVPAPATANILKGVPIYQGDIKSELCTPTGAAILKHFVTKFIQLPEMEIEKIGYGLGKKDFEVANALRAVIGSYTEDVTRKNITKSADNKQDNDTVKIKKNSPKVKNITDQIIQLSFNVDDMTGEEIGFLTERLFAEGGLDVYTQAISMKKNRPATLITVLCKEEKREAIVQAIFSNSTTLGIREENIKRYILNRKSTKVETPLGDIRVKNVEGYGVNRSKYEYDDIVEIAKANNMTLMDVKRIISESVLNRK